MRAYRHQTIKVKDCDTDLTIVLPNGQQMILQYRIEGPSMDVILDRNYPVICWEGTDMVPAPALEKSTPSVRVSGQLVIGLNAPQGKKFKF